METPVYPNQKEELLRQYFGFSRFRNLQEEVIDCLMADENCLVLMPTGGGKSICYQLTALMKPGITLVVSPLIALMKDQVESLLGNGIPAAYINSSLSSAEQNQVWTDCRRGRVRLLYLAPERLMSPATLAGIRELPLSLLAIDEAHCISSWGHDFRPEYRQLRLIRETFPRLPVIALTATADLVTRRDILNELEMPDARVFLSSFDRPGISLEVGPGTERKKHILNFILQHPGEPGIVYCLSRKSCEDLAAFLRGKGVPAGYYHAGADPAHRGRVQDGFLRDQIQVMCATVAFGMGIDKSNIRWILHLNLPENVESFYQEIGRAGRDGLSARTVLFYSYGDWIQRMDMIARSEAPPEQKELRKAKLERMRQYAEASICRRKILLSYFNEETAESCGNCDICHNPPTTFDGTVLAQKALSAVYRTREKISLTTTVEILRGLRSIQTVRHGYTELPTFGVGKDVRSEFWTDYLLQMLNQGVMDIAYDEGHAFRLNARSHRILKGEEQVSLVAARLPGAVSTRPAPEPPPKEKARIGLFEQLKSIRMELSGRHGLPPYQIFSDATLRDMADSLPLTPLRMLDIQGMTGVRYQRFGGPFLDAIRQTVLENHRAGTKMGKGVTLLVTKALFDEGGDVEAIATARNLSPSTIAGHLTDLVREGDELNLFRLVSQADLEAVAGVLRSLGLRPGPETPERAVLDYLGPAAVRWRIHLAMFLLEKQSG